MTAQNRPFRTALYLPASNSRALAKAATLGVDALIFDLEDAVAPSEKLQARDNLVAALKSTEYGHRARIVRINALSTPWGKDDLEAFAAIGVEALLLPKVDGAGDIERVDAALNAHSAARQTQLWAMMETPRGILNAAAIAAAPRMAGFVMGTNDLAKDVHADGRGALGVSLQLCLLAARAHGLICLDGVYNAFKDDEGLAAECEDGRRLGFDGKTIIHPAQVQITNDAFSPPPAAIDLARRQMEAFAEAEARGEGVAVLDGKIVENLHVAEARALLAKAEAIARQQIAAQEAE